MIDQISGGRPVFSTRANAGIVAGIGLRLKASGADLLDLLDTCLAEAGLARSDILALATLDRKQAYPALAEVAGILNVPILPVAVVNLLTPVPNPSLQVAGHIGHGSVAEAAALHFGPLLVEKRRGANVTCALAQCRYAPAALKAEMAASTVSTSSAGP